MPTASPKNRRFLIASVCLIAAAVLGYAGWILVRVDAMGREAYLLRTRASAVATAPTDVPAALELYAEIDAIDAWLEAHAPAAAALATPSQWVQPDEEVAAVLAPLAPFYERVDALLARPIAKTLVLAGTPAPRESSLASRRNWTNLLVTRALFEGALGRWDEAADRIAQAFDVARLGDDGTPIGASVRIGNEGIALAALRQLVAYSDVDVTLLRTRVEPALARAADPKLPAAAVANEFARWCDEGRVIPHRCLDRCAWLARPYHFTWAREELTAYAEVVEEALRQAHGAASLPIDTEGHLVLERTTIENEAFSAKTCLEIGLLARSRVAVARIALALEAHRAEHGAWPSKLDELAYAFPDGLPSDPCSSVPIWYTVDDGEPELGPLAFAEARAFGPQNASGLLLRWTLSPGRP